MRGCDVASFQGTIDFDALKTQVGFVIAKATEGTGFVDPMFSRNWSEAKRVGLRAGGYHFARPDLGTSPGDEAAYFLDNLPPIEAGDLLALDYEAQWNGDVVGWCKAFLDAIRDRSGHRALIYLNLSLIRGHDWSPVIDGGYPLWLATYDNDPDNTPQTPWPAVVIKQWTESGRIAGISGNVDLDSLYEEAEGMVSRDEFQSYQTDVRNSFEAIKSVLTSLASRGARGEARAGAALEQIKDPQLRAIVEAILNLKL